MAACVEFIRTDKVDSFKQLHPLDRIYEMDYLKGDRVGQIAYFEVIDWIVKVQIIKVTNSKTYFKRIEKMSFEESEV